MQSTLNLESDQTKAAGVLDAHATVSKTTKSKQSITPRNPIC